MASCRQWVQNGRRPHEVREVAVPLDDMRSARRTDHSPLPLIGRTALGETMCMCHTCVNKSPLGHLQTHLDQLCAERYGRRHLCACAACATCCISVPSRVSVTHQAMIWWCVRTSTPAECDNAV